MTSFDRIKVECGNCSQETEQMVLVGITTGGGVDLDLRPQDARRSIMCALLQECENCGLVAQDLETADTIGMDTKEYKELRAVGGPVSKFSRASHLAAQSGDLRQAGAYALQAAWMIDDAGGDATAWRGHAADLMKPEGDEETLQLTDVLRRAKLWDRAEKALETVSTDNENIRAVAGLLGRLIEDRNAKCYSVADSYSGVV